MIDHFIAGLLQSIRPIGDTLENSLTHDADMTKTQGLAFYV